jgi:hypothetical protein
MKTLTIELYTAEELLEKDERALDKAHERYTQELWDYGIGTEQINDAMLMIAEEEGSFLLGRFLEWDLYRGEIGYASGTLSGKEYGRLYERFPELEEMDLSFTVRHGLIEQDRDYCWNDTAEPLIDKANDYLRDLYGRMMDAARQEQEWIESRQYFLDACEANEYTFEANGQMRNG